MLGITRSSYYRWRQARGTRRERENGVVMEEIRRIWEEGRQEYGSPRIEAVLREREYRVNHKRVARLMRQMGIRSKTVRRFKHTTRRCTDQLAAPNLLQQRFHAEEPNRVWLSDITYVRTKEGWLYLTAIEDVFSRLPVGYAMREDLSAQGVVQALRMACGRREVKPGLVFHSDRGKQYADGEVRELLRDHQMVQSMSSTGNCYDNAMAESFFATIKKGVVHGRQFETRAEARQVIFEYLEVFYSRVRRHSSLGDKSPVAFEQLHKMAILPVAKMG